MSECDDSNFDGVSSSNDEIDNHDVYIDCESDNSNVSFDSDSSENDDTYMDFEKNYDNLDYMNEKIHHDLKCTKRDALIVLLMIYLKHNMTWVCLMDVIEFINTIFSIEVIPKSKYLFKKFFPLHLKSVYHFYCDKCKLLKEDLSTTICENCGSNVNINSSKGNNFFITLPIEKQIIDLVRCNIQNIEQPVINTSMDIRDVFDGMMYKNTKTLNIVQTLSVVFNTDGIKIYKSKNKSELWPIQFSLNELCNKN